MLFNEVALPDPKGMKLNTTTPPKQKANPHTKSQFIVPIDNIVSFFFIPIVIV